MRACPILVFCVLLLTLPVAAHAVSTGDSRERDLLTEARFALQQSMAVKENQARAQRLRERHFNVPFTHKARQLRRSDHGCAVTVERVVAPRPAHPADAARARIMGSFERARNEIYARSGR